jgi:hypothetical protein
LRAITDRLLEPAPGSLRAKLEELRESAVSRLSKSREPFACPENTQEAQEALAERGHPKHNLQPRGNADFLGGALIV